MTVDIATLSLQRYLCPPLADTQSIQIIRFIRYYIVPQGQSQAERSDHNKVRSASFVTTRLSRRDNNQRSVATIRSTQWLVIIRSASFVTLVLARRANPKRSVSVAETFFGD